MEFYPTCAGAVSSKRLFDDTFLGLASHLEKPTVPQLPQIFSLIIEFAQVGP